MNVFLVDTEDKYHVPPLSVGGFVKNLIEIK